MKDGNLYSTYTMIQLHQLTTKSADNFLDGFYMLWF